MRNKWAGHACLNRTVDVWADGDKSIILPLLEDALVRVINAYQDMSTLIQLSEELAALAQPAPPTAKQLLNNSKSVDMSIAWSNVNPFAQICREQAKKEFECLIDQLTSPPKYGDPTDNDTSDGSVHAKRRRKIHELAMSLSFEGRQ